MAADSNMFTVPATLADRYRTEEERIGPQTVVPEASPAVGDISFFLSTILSCIYFTARIGVRARAGYQEKANQHGW